MQLLKKIVKFGLVGCCGILIDFTLTWLFKDLVGINKYAANTVGFTFAASSNYLLNRAWTFRSTNEQIMREYVVFVGIAVAGLLLSNSIIWFLHDKTHLLGFYWSKVSSVVLVFGWNFSMNHLLNFKALEPGDEVTA